MRLSTLGYYILLAFGVAFTVYIFGFVLLMLMGDIAYFIESLVR